MQYISKVPEKDIFSRFKELKIFAETELYLLQKLHPLNVWKKILNI